MPPPPKYSDYVVLAVIVGWLGVHNFYARRFKDAVVQLILGLIVLVCLFLGYRSGSLEGGACLGSFPGFWLVLSIISDLINTKKDGWGRRFRY